jgi:acyl carrier protein
MQTMTMETTDIIEVIRDILCEDLDLGLRRDAIAADASLGDDGLALDSISMAEFVNALETRFGIRILDEDLDGANFANLTSVAALVLLRGDGRVAA